MCTETLNLEEVLERVLNSDVQGVCVCLSLCVCQ